MKAKPQSPAALNNNRLKGIENDMDDIDLV